MMKQCLQSVTITQQTPQKKTDFIYSSVTCLRFPLALVKEHSDLNQNTNRTCMLPVSHTALSSVKPPKPSRCRRHMSQGRRRRLWQVVWHSRLRSPKRVVSAVDRRSGSTGCGGANEACRRALQPKMQSVVLRALPVNEHRLATAVPGPNDDVTVQIIIFTFRCFISFYLAWRLGLGGWFHTGLICDT